jgi:Ca-activated chloride channel family protein
MTMSLSRRLTFALSLVLSFAVAAAAGAAPLKEQGLVALIEAGFDDAEIIAKLEKDGVAFENKQEVVERLKTAGASDAVVAAVEKAKSAAAPAASAPAKPVIEFSKIIALLEGGVESDVIIAQLAKSAATYTLGADQEKQLRDAGATDELIAAMKQGAKSADAPEPISDLALVLDVSNSMNEATADGRSKLEVAKEVVGDLVKKIPEGLNVTVVVYGHVPGCSAVKVLRPLAELKAADRGPLAAELSALKAVGNTPIALALRLAGEQFAGRKTYCGVVLITDGLESCNGDPAAEAARLAENPMLRFGVNVVGFGLQEAESARTEQIAASGKGKYYSAQDRAGLLAALEEVTKKLNAGANPAPFNPATPTGRRAVVVAAPKIALPALKEIVSCEQEATYYTVESYKVNKVNAYDAEIRQPSAKPIDLWWAPQKGIPVKMVAQLENPERRVHTIRPEDYLGVVRVTSETPGGKARIVVTKPETSKGTVDSYKVQEIVGYGEDMAVPVGTYMLWVVPEGEEPTLLEEEIQVAAGQVSAFEN